MAFSHRSLLFTNRSITYCYYYCVVAAVAGAAAAVVVVVGGGGGGGGGVCPKHSINIDPDMEILLA